MSKLILLSTALWLMSTHWALAQAGGTGGMGIERNGQVMTFYSAGIRVISPNPIDPTQGKSEIPGLKELQDFILQPSDAFDEYDKSSLLTVLLPSKNRTYFDVDQSWLNPENRARLIAKYQKVTGVPESQLRIFAVTDSSEGKTYIFPEFYQLNPIEQASILYHELFWILHPNATYERVIAVEAAFQNYMTHPKSHEALFEFIELNGNAAIEELLMVALILDYEKGVINHQGYITNGAKKVFLTMENIVGPETMDCIKNSQWWSLNRCKPYILAHARHLVQDFPQSRFLKIYHQQVYEGDIYRTYSFKESHHLPLGIYSGGNSRNAETKIVLLPAEGINQISTEPDTFLGNASLGAIDNDTFGLEIYDFSPAD